MATKEETMAPQQETSQAPPPLAEDITADTLTALLDELSQEGRALLDESGESAAAAATADPLAGIIDLEQHRTRVEAEMHATERALLADNNFGAVNHATAHALLHKAEATLASVQATLDSYQQVCVRLCFFLNLPWITAFSLFFFLAWTV